MVRRRDRRNGKFPLGKLAKIRKEQDVVYTQILDANPELEEKQQTLRKKRKRLKRLQERIEKADREKAEAEIKYDEGVKAGKRKKAMFLSQKSVSLRKKKPSKYVAAGDRQEEVKERAMRKRRKLTYEAAQEIHGGTEEDQNPGEVGLLETALKNCSKKVLMEGLSKDKKFNQHILPALVKSKVANYEKSDENITRSIAIYYNGGVVGKRKFRNVYKDSNYVKDKSGKSSRMTMDNCLYPRYVPYNRLSPFLNAIDIGNLCSVKDDFCYGLSSQEQVNGVYRKLKELLLRLAEYYLTHRQSDLIWFNGEVNTFCVALGGDGAPFGKEDTACAFLVSFLSSNENFLLFGGNCPEDCEPVGRFINQLAKEIQEVEQEVFPLKVDDVYVDVKFRVTALPNDMKMLAFLAGELSNSATYFLTFANVCNNDCANLSYSFGNSPEDHWHPWSYSRRLAVAQKVAKFKGELERKKLAPKTKRSKVTSFIAKDCKSRQEFVPPIGPKIDVARADPLHLKNNACALAHRYLLNEVIYQSNLKNSSIVFSQVPATSHFARYIKAMREECYPSRLSNRIVRWFNETTGDKEFEYRFTGRDSRFFVKNFMFLIAAVDPRNPGSGRANKVYHWLAFLCLCLRHCISLFSRVEISDQQVTELRGACLKYYRANVVFYKVNPTVWTIGHVVPAHTAQMKALYGLGLGINSMEGREAKHVFISRYAANTIPKNRWLQLFRHEFVSLIWLRERGYNLSKPSSTTDSYIPERVKQPEFCNCGMSKGKQESLCYYCAHPLRTEIIASITPQAKDM